MMMLWLIVYGGDDDVGMRIVRMMAMVMVVGIM